MAVKFFESLNNLDAIVLSKMQVADMTIKVIKLDFELLFFTG